MLPVGRAVRRTASRMAVAVNSRRLTEPKIVSLPTLRLDRRSVTPKPSIQEVQ